MSLNIQDMIDVPYTCKGKGGLYYVIDISKGAGTSKGECLVIYEDTDKMTYHRTVEDFMERMEEL